MGTRVCESPLCSCAAQPAGRGSCSTPPDTLMRLCLEFCVYFEKDGKKLEKVQKRTRDMVRLLEHAALRGEVQELRFSLVKGWVMGEVTAVHN